MSDAEIRQYVIAALAVNRIRQDTSIPEADQNVRFIEAIRTAGLTADRFNQISQAMATDADLNRRIQAAAAQQSAAPPPATLPSAPTR